MAVLFSFRVRLICQVLALLAVAFAALPQQTPAPPAPCSDPRFHQFDFLIGDWQAYSPNGKLGGYDRITPIYDGCALQEEWRGPAQPPKFRGGSVSAFDPRSGRWRQVWNDNQGVSAQMEGGLVVGRMVLLGEAGSGAAGRLVRLSWEPLQNGEVRQTLEYTDGPGGTWATATTFLYRRVEAAAMLRP